MAYMVLFIATMALGMYARDVYSFPIHTYQLALATGVGTFITWFIIKK